MTSTMEFDCKLAHRDEIKRISNFNSIKDLYERVSQTFGLSTSEILYCTLNTHNFRDMSALLGNYLSFGDLIIVHLCGSVRELTLRKAHEFLGLTITDNASGRAFVKKVSSSDASVSDNIRPGDHIAAINSESTVGLRHYEVAKAIRLLPQSTSFTIRLIEPRHAEGYQRALADLPERENISLFANGNHNGSHNNHNSNSSNNNNNNNSHCNSNGSGSNTTTNSNTDSGNSLLLQRHELSGPVSLSSTCDDLINSSLPIDRLLSKSNRLNKGDDFTTNTSGRPDLIGGDRRQDDYKSTIDRINAHLESFLGINDNLLAIKIYRLARENRDSFGAFAGAIAKSELQVFNFDEEMKTYLWRCATEPTVF